MSLPSALPSPLVIQVALHPEDFRESSGNPDPPRADIFRYAVDLIKLEHVLAGIYMSVILTSCPYGHLWACSWEYFTTLDVEWNLYRGKKRKGATSTAWVSPGHV
jgi:hypothetical protein